MPSDTSVFPLTVTERLILALLVVGVLALLVTVPATMALVSLAISILVLWLLWRLVQAAERIAAATEAIAVDDD